MNLNLTKNRNNEDSAWKDILDVFFKDCLDYCLPTVSELINWDKHWLSLDKELRAITKGSKTGKNLVDKLFKVFLKDGREQWLFFHLEVQGRVEVDFAERMFSYYYRIYDKYKKPVVSCAILTDDKVDWRPSSFQMGLGGCHLNFDFLVIKILDYANKKAELEVAKNPFASVLYTQLEVIEAKKKSDNERKNLKFSLTKRLYDKGYNKEEIGKLYQFIDWLIGLPEPLELEYMSNIHELEESKKMAYITSAEKIGIERGKLEVAEEMLKTGSRIDTVKKLTKLPLAKLKAIQAKLKGKSH